MRLSIHAIRIGLGVAAFAFLSACASGPDHIQIKFYQLTRGDHYKCDPTEKEEKCGDKPFPNRTAAQENKAGTLHFIPPNKCEGRFSLMTIENVDSDSPTLYVVCSPQEN